ncbi:hypothetical protein [Reyranella sp.]|jgi:hypothetical protein|uniref:hypothetical protein n=1 Tax=Reyranella sp. TaxID=1929291 RepID=UPI003D0C5697
MPDDDAEAGSLQDSGKVVDLFPLHRSPLPYKHEQSARYRTSAIHLEILLDPCETAAGVLMGLG